MEITFNPIGTIHTCFKEKFGIPRQPNLIKELTAKIELFKDYSDPTIVKDLETFSHIWIIFFFNQIKQGEWSPSVRPPRLGGNKRIGLLASRSPYRPNPIGISPAKLLQIEIINKKIVIDINGVDLMDQTPILDLKPYIPQVDSLPDANNGWTNQATNSEIKEVTFSKFATEQLNSLSEGLVIKKTIEQILFQDPRPGYKKSINKIDFEKNKFAFKIYDFDVHWMVKSKNHIEVLKLIKI